MSKNLIKFVDHSATLLLVSFVSKSVNYSSRSEHVNIRETSCLALIGLQKRQSSAFDWAESSKTLRGSNSCLIGTHKVSKEALSKSHSEYWYKVEPPAIITLCFKVFLNAILFFGKLGTRVTAFSLKWKLPCWLDFFSFSRPSGLQKV